MKQDSPKSRAVPVLVPMPAERPYTYAVPEGMDVMSGSIVRVPLGPREVAGIVWDGPVETVEGAMDRRTRGGPRGQLRRILRGGCGEIRTGPEQRDEPFVRPAAQLVGEGARGCRPP